MSTLFVVLHILVGTGHHQHWQKVFTRHEATTQSMLCQRRAKGLRDEAKPGPRQRLEIWCRPEPDQV